MATDGGGHSEAVDARKPYPRSTSASLEAVTEKMTEVAGPFGERVGIVLGSFWDRFGVGSELVRGRFGVGSGSVRGLQDRVTVSKCCMTQQL